MDEFSLRKTVSFTRAEQGDFIPTIMQSGVLSEEFKALAWREIYNLIDIGKTMNPRGQYFLSEINFKIISDVFVELFFFQVDKIYADFYFISEKLKEIVYSPDYRKTLELIQGIIRHPSVRDVFCKKMDNVFKRTYVGYRILDKTIVPYMSQDEIDVVLKSNKIISLNGKGSVKFHLRCSVDFMNKGVWSSSVRESITAVESLMKASYPGKEFRNAMNDFQEGTGIHKALKEAIVRMYGYSSDEQGIRHALFDKDAPDVDDADAIYMYSACVAFISYVMRKNRIPLV